MKITMLYGQWAQNIGNAFFNLGGEYVFEKAVPGAHIYRIMDQPNYRTLHNKFNGNPKNFWDPISTIDTDLVVLQGPVLNSWFGLSWESTLKNLFQRNKKYALHSASFFKFTEKELADVRTFLKKYPPAFISTRDSNAHDIIKSWELEIPLIDGIDAGFFVNLAYQPPKTIEGEQLIALNFDRYPEPELIAAEKEDPDIIIGQSSYDIIIPKRLNQSAAKSKVRAYVSELFDNRKLPSMLDKYKVVRPEHRFFPHMTKKIYKRSNSFSSDDPFTYLTCYANAAVTLSDRVHACVATLAYGNRAMLFTPSPRSALFERVGAKAIKTKCVKLDPTELAQLQQSHIGAIARVLRDI